MLQGLQPRLTAAQYRALITKKTAAPKRSKAGARPDISLSIYFRSAWEANFARYLNLLMKMGVVESWAHEPETFWFEGIKRGTCSYKPDFKVWYVGDPKPEYVEIKGRVLPTDKTKWKRMAKYHPGVRLVIVGKKEYAWIRAKWAGAIPAWE
jgi:hypothetical protein